VGDKAQLLCAECLGLLGAIDPARLNVKALPPEALFEVIGDLLRQLFSKHLIRLLRVAPSLAVLNATTFAIQVSCLRFIFPSPPPPHMFHTPSPTAYAPP